MEQQRRTLELQVVSAKDLKNMMKKNLWTRWTSHSTSLSSSSTPRTASKHSGPKLRHPPPVTPPSTVPLPHALPLHYVLSRSTFKLTQHNWSTASLLKLKPSLSAAPPVGPMASSSDSLISPGTSSPCRSTQSVQQKPENSGSLRRCTNAVASGLSS
ncbi:hypothetical protein ACLB2K_042970 [Fragaria x ananassa]